MPQPQEEASRAPRREFHFMAPDLARELERAYSETRRSEEDLRSAVHDFVAELRAGGATPEEAVIAVKSALRAPTAIPVRVMTADPIASRVVNWCIDDYFRVD